MGGGSVPVLFVSSLCELSVPLCEGENEGEAREKGREEKKRKKRKHGEFFQTLTGE
jgi:hypothetical protein